MSLAKTYVEWELAAQNLTFSRACESIGIPEATVDAFLAAFSDYETTVKIVILLGAILGSPVNLARVCGYKV